MSTGDAPLILTAQLPQDLHARYTALRRAHFPPERNYLEAHVTLFHALPAMSEEEVTGWCRRIASEYAPVPAKAVGLMSLGQGTAIRLESPAMLRLRDRLADALHGLLTAQDQHRPRLHVTIQNKVTPAEAKTLQAQLAGAIQPQAFAFRGLALHRYLGGPWEPLKTFAFRGRAEA
ncbi:2'-5' RNA ligase family protein [Erythrobacter mangrovi]|uniref:2'-5' RNA ligase family protein n=1 Tax=Erythrobacter mangrovi TaxID=2739433 RepID=A0A7D4B7P4_9SPHN|nr:2'-5' RNA ligase family protein [Erythrobacter mangrovi]QKG71243.1 2'-5' RNA ligase family protein [Erythrobacter mangrovi]